MFTRSTTFFISITYVNKNSHEIQFFKSKKNKKLYFKFSSTLTKSVYKLDMHLFVKNSSYFSIVTISSTNLLY